MNFFDIGRAHPAGRDFDQQFSGAYSWNWQMLQPQIIDPTIDHGAHFFRNCKHIAVLPNEEQI
jgi:hypothetical protein